MPIVINNDPAPPTVAPAAIVPLAFPKGVKHLDLPFRYVRGAPAVNEQDSIEDIAVCVQAVLLTEPGARDEAPEFGYVDPAFSQQPVSPARLITQVERFEPRASVLVDIAPAALDEAIENANVKVQVNQ